MMYGLPNSVKMLEISLQTAELVERGKFPYNQEFGEVVS